MGISQLNRPAKIYVFTGKPGSGKTTLSRWLSIERNIPRFAKDDLKEALFDSCGEVDRELSKKLGRAAIKILYSHIETFAKHKIDAIIDCNFLGDFARPILVKIVHTYHAELLEVFCQCDDVILKDRFIARAKSPIRHRHHQDLENLPEMLSLLAAKAEPLGIADKVLVCRTDTSLKDSKARVTDFISQFD